MLPDVCEFTTPDCTRPSPRPIVPLLKTGGELCYVARVTWPVLPDVQEFTTPDCPRHSPRTIVPLLKTGGELCYVARVTWPVFYGE